MVVPKYNYYKEVLETTRELEVSGQAEGRDKWMVAGKKITNIDEVVVAVGGGSGDDVYSR